MVRPIVWAALGVACLFVGLPLSLAFRLGILVLAFGTLFLALAAVQWLWDHLRGSHHRRDEEEDD